MIIRERSIYFRNVYFILGKTVYFAFLPIIILASIDFNEISESEAKMISRDNKLKSLGI